MKLAALLLLACGSAYAQYTPPPSSGGGGGGNPTLSVTNSASTGTTINTLTKLAHTSLIATAVIASAADTGLVVGITTAGAGTSGTATITIAGVVPCVFDNAPTSGHYLQISASQAGNCHDTGSTTYPTSGQVVGRALVTSLSTGTFNIDLFPSEIQAPEPPSGLQGLITWSEGAFTPSSLSYCGPGSPSCGNAQFIMPACTAQNLNVYVPGAPTVANSTFTLMDLTTSMSTGLTVTATTGGSYPTVLTDSTHTSLLTANHIFAVAFNVGGAMPFGVYAMYFQCF